MAAAAACIAAPLILMCLRSLQIGMNCFKLHGLWSDEMVYWREVYNFIHTGIAGGYTGCDDMAPALANFGTHSFLNTVIYGAFGAVFGWNNNSIMIYNLVFLMLCITVFVYWVRPSIRQLLILLAATVFYLPLYYYAPTSMTELLGYGGIVLYTGALLCYEREAKERWFFVLLACTVFLSFFKLPNMVFFIPLVLAIFEGKFTRRFTLRTLGCMASCVLIYMINSAFTSPYPWFFSEVFEQKTVGKMIAKVWGRFTENLSHFFSLGYGTRQEQMQRYFYLFLFLLFVCLTVYFFRKKQAQKGKLALSYVLLLLASFTLNNAFYEVWDWRDYRMMAPVAWGALIGLLFLEEKIWTALAAVAVATMFFYEIAKPNEVFINWERTEPLPENTVCELVHYDAQTENPFDNTIAVEFVNLGIYYGLEPGIGVQNIFTPEAITKSKYILVSTPDYDFPGYSLSGQGTYGYLYIRNSLSK